MHATAKDRANDEPQGPRQVAELRREGWSNERTGTGDGGKMMAKENPFVGGNEVPAVVVTFGGRGACIVESEDTSCDKC